MRKPKSLFFFSDLLYTQLWLQAVGAVLCLRILIAAAIYCASCEPSIPHTFVFHPLCYCVTWTLVLFYL